MYSLMETAKLNGLAPFAYLREVIGCIADQPIRHIEELLPWHLVRRHAAPRDATPAEALAHERCAA